MKSQFAQILSFYIKWLNQVLNVRLLSTVGAFNMHWHSFVMIYRYNKRQYNIPFEVLCDEFNQFLFDYNEDADFYMSFIFEYEKKFSIQPVEVFAVTPEQIMEAAEYKMNQRVLNFPNH